MCRNALNDLKTQYKKVHLLGHSMGTAIAAIIGCADADVGKIVYVSPSFENKDMGLFSRIALAVCSLFTPRLKCNYHASAKYHLHYENAPCDNEYFGNEYWRFYFTNKLAEYYGILKKGLYAIKKYPHEHLVIYPEKDFKVSGASVKLYKRAVGERANIVSIKNGTHCVLYDKDTDAENQAVSAIMTFAKETDR